MNCYNHVPSTVIWHANKMQKKTQSADSGGEEDSTCYNAAFAIQYKSGCVELMLHLAQQNIYILYIVSLIK